ncbi:hypothetical protein SPHV1_770010 [Novosphingobium sp. KN65.2]|nr:hypothetical protein SPHV1_770010 [Novosphingobium sp. KN65.2]
MANCESESQKLGRTPEEYGSIGRAVSKATAQRQAERPETTGNPAPHAHNIVARRPHFNAAHRTPSLPHSPAGAPMREELDYCRFAAKATPCLIPLS